MARREFTLTRDPEALARLVRILDASVNVEVLSALVTARKETRTGGWVFLSDLAKRVGQAPVTSPRRPCRPRAWTRAARSRGRARCP